MEEKGELMQRKIIKTRNDILSYALELFKTKGYESVSLDEIAHAATLSRATLYNYYQNKKTIYFAIYVQYLSDKIEEMKDILEVNVSGKEILLMLCNRMIRNLNENLIQSRIMNRILTENTKHNNIARKAYEKRKSNPNYKETKFKNLETIMADFLERILLLQEKWKFIVEKGIEDGSIKTYLPPIQLINYIFMLINGIIDQMYLKQIGLENKDVQLSYEIIENITMELIQNLLG